MALIVLDGTVFVTASGETIQEATRQCRHSAVDISSISCSSLTIAATPDSVETATVDFEHHIRHRSGVATAKHTANCIITTMDIGGDGLARHGHAGLVAAAKHLVDGIFRSGYSMIIIILKTIGVGIDTTRCPDIHGDIVLRHTVDIVAAEYAATVLVGSNCVGTDDGRALDILRITGSIQCAGADIDRYHAVDQCHYVFMASAEGSFVAQAAAIDGAIDNTTVDIHLGSITIIGVDITLGGATVEVAVEDGAGCSGAIIDLHIAADSSLLTIAATEDAVGTGARSANNATFEVHLSVASHCAADVAAAIDTFGHGATLEGDLGGAIGNSHAGIVAAAEDAIRDIGVTADRYLRRDGSIGHIAATEDIMDGAVGDLHLDGAIRSTFDVVATEDIIRGAAGDTHTHGAIDSGGNALIAFDIGIIGLTQTAAIDIADCAAIEEDGGAIVARHGGSAHIGQSTATIDVVLQSAAEDRDLGLAQNIGQIATAEDVTGLLARTDQSDTGVAVFHGYIGVSMHLSLFATTVDVLHNRYMMIIIIVADSHHGIGCDRGGVTQATAIDIASDAVAFLDMVDIHSNHIAIFGCLVAAAIHIFECQLAVRLLFVLHSDGDIAADIAQHVAAAESVGDSAAIEVHFDIAADGGIDILVGVTRVTVAFRATIDVVVGATVEVEGDIATDGSHVRAAINLFNLVVDA